MVDTAVILAGGKSSRYGRPKGLELIDGQPMVVRLAEQVRAAGISNICISTDDPEPYRSLGLKIIPDCYHGCGPLAGIHSALLKTRAETLLVLACDLPAISSTELETLISSAENEPALIVYAATESQEHPLCSVVRSELIGPLTTTLEEDKNAVLRFFHGLQHRKVFFHDERPFLNMNVPDDLRALESKNAF
jgi:molybdopterin-guanine dinucleotide biosynthesis protein A